MPIVESFDLPFGRAFTVYGVLIEVRTNHFDLLGEIEKLLPAAAKRERSKTDTADFTFAVIWDERNERIGEFYRNIERNVCEGDTDHSLRRLETSIRLTIAEFAPNLVFVHAGVVAIGNAGVIIPGSSNTGKTTLTAALVRAGAIYYSDEYAIFDENGWIHPFPKPLSIREPWAFGMQVDYAVETLGGRAGTEPVRAKMIVVTEYEAEKTWQPVELSAGEGILELLAHTVSARSNPRQALNILPRGVENALILKGKRGDADAVSEEIKKVLAKNAFFA